MSPLPHPENEPIDGPESPRFRSFLHFSGNEPVSNYEVSVSDTQNRIQVDHAQLKAIVRRVLNLEEFPRASISIVITDNFAIRAINNRNLGHDWPTDVITFPMSDEGEDLLAGEIVVSGEMARETADEYGQDPWEEFVLYLVHGLLHLSGYDDQDPIDAKEMRRREGEVMAELGLKNPFSLVDSRSPRHESE